jgi:acetyl-CoA C-acetyltransferase
VEIAILGGVRTPFGALGGALSGAPAERLGGVALAASLQRAKLERARLREVWLGSVFDSGRGPNPARALLLEGEGDTDVWGLTVRAGGASGLEALARAATGLGANEAAAIVGADSASRAPYLLPEARGGSRLGSGRLVDGAARDAWVLSDEDIPATGHAIAASKLLGVDRAKLDELRARSVERAKASPRDEVAPTPIPSMKGGDQDVGDDDLAGARPAPPNDLAYAAPLSDGAAAVVVAGLGLARELGVPAARLVAVERVSLEPGAAATAPAKALAKLLASQGRSARDLRAVEVDESLTAAPFAARKELEIAEERLNARGGAHAYGHAGGACGLAALVRLLAELERAGGGQGAVAYGAAGGAAIALVVER